MPRRFLVFLICLALARSAQPAVCMNKFLSRAEGPRQIVTLLTGKLTYQEAQALAVSIKRGQAPPLEWLTDNGKSISKQHGELKIVRPMPVGCDGKPSGVIMIATFLSAQRPTRKMNVRLDATTTVGFDEQAK
jgi:hypothetical protein